jgi:hypothetical protein
MTAEVLIIIQRTGNSKRNASIQNANTQPSTMQQIQSNSDGTLTSLSNSFFFFINKPTQLNLKQIYSAKFKGVPLPFSCSKRCPRAPSRSCSSTVETTSVPPSQMLGVLYFPLSPLSRKEATHSPDGIPSFPSRLARLSYHSNTS